MQRFFVISMVFAILTMTGVTWFASAARAADAPTTYRVVFQVTSDTPKGWEDSLRNVKNLRESLGAKNTTIEVVAHSGGLGMVLKANDSSGQVVSELIKEGVAFVACENTMARKNVTADQLLPGVTTVDSGVAQVVRRQAEGWQYIRNGG